VRSWRCCGGWLLPERLDEAVFDAPVSPLVRRYLRTAIGFLLAGLGLGLWMLMVIGYNRANASPTLKLFLSRTDELIARVSEKVGRLTIEPARVGAG
jgi:hypothetical protein